MDTRIFIMTHKEITPVPYEGYEMLQVGSALHDDLGYIRDDTGDNISEKNPYYCELTGMYWLWKNVSCDNIGIVHYRRYFFDDKGDFLTKDDAEGYLQRADAVLPLSGFATDGGRDMTVYEQYRDRHYIGDLELCRTVIDEKYPGYTRAFDNSVKNGYFIMPGNMWITRKDIFDSYCSWLFEILFEVEKRSDISGYDDYQKRIYGFLSERLLRVWLLMQPLKVIEIDMQMRDSSDIANEAKKNSLLEKYMTLKLSPLFDFHAGQPGASLIPPFESDDDLDGKAPVWIYLPDGEKNISKAAQLCIASIKKNIPSDRARVRITTNDNILRYATLTDVIIDKYKRGAITPEHLSEVLRAELLYRYGGMWISPSWAVTGRLSEDIFDSRIFTLKVPGGILRRTDPSGGRWTNDLWAAAPGHEFFKYMTEALWFYFEAEEKPVEDSVIDHVIAAGIKRYPQIMKDIEDIPETGKNCFYLQSVLNRRAVPKRLDEINENGIFQRIDISQDYPVNLVTGEKTVYGSMAV